MKTTVYPKTYAHGFCFAVLCCGYTLTDFPIPIGLTSLALWQSNDCPSASKATLMNMDKYFMWIHYERLHNHNKAKHNKTVCIFLGIYCSHSHAVMTQMHQHIVALTKCLIFCKRIAQMHFSWVEILLLWLKFHRFFSELQLTKYVRIGSGDDLALGIAWTNDDQCFFRYNELTLHHLNLCSRKTVNNQMHDLNSHDLIKTVAQ